MLAIIGMFCVAVGLTILKSLEEDKRVLPGPDSITNFVYTLFGLLELIAGFFLMFSYLFMRLI